jgi:hypothetical protein
MIMITDSVVVGAPVDEAFVVVAARFHDLYPLWQPAVHRIRFRSSAPIRLGSILTQARSDFGLYQEIECQVTQYKPGRIFAFRSMAGSLDLTVRYDFEHAHHVTTVKVHFTLRGGSLWRLAEHLFAPRIRRQVNTSLIQLQSLLEADSSVLNGTCMKSSTIPFLFHK